MCELGINPECFNPRILYMFKRKFNDTSKVTYHCHDFSSLIFILSGSCTYNISNTMYQVKKGDILLCNPGVYHGKILTAGQEVTEFHAGFNNICIKNLPKDCLIDYSTSPLLGFPQYEQDFLRCCSEILHEQEKMEPAYELVLKSLFMKFIALLFRATHANEMSGDSSCVTLESHERATIVNAIVSFISDNYMKEISLDRISRNMYLSSVYISKVFKEEMGESPINYLIKYRLSKARSLLEDGNMSVKAVAKSVGYHDAYHFSKLFKKYYGYPPSKHKKAV